MKIGNTPADEQVEEMGKGYDVSRRRFFQLAGGIAGAGVLLSACHRTGPTDVYIGSGDTALLNYIYILQQVEAAFYIQAVTTNYYSMSRDELILFTDMRDQEVAHREYLKFLLGTNAIAPINIAFSSVTFADRASVLTSGAQLEDLVVSGLIGAVPLFSNLEYIRTFAKMVSVEARHSAYLRDVHQYNTFADTTVVGANGIGSSASPSSILETVRSKYILTRFDTSKLPN